MLFTTGFIVFLTVFVLSSIVIFTIINKKKFKKKQKIGLMWLILLRDFLSHIQQHRGLTTGYLNGDLSLEHRINELQIKLDSDITEIYSIDSWMFDNENWRSIVDHWGRLKENVKTNTIDNNLVQHGKLIRNILYIIEEMAEDHKLLQLDNIDQYGVDFIWKNLLEATEYMGQARALGTGISASKVCGSVEKIKLNYLMGKIKESEKLIIGVFPNTESVHFNIGLLLDTIEKNFFQNDDSQHLISANEYFDLATKALNGVYSEYDSVVADLKASLSGGKA